LAVTDKEITEAQDSDLPLQEDPGTPARTEEPGYLATTGEAVGDDGSVVPIIGGLPAAEGSAWDIGAPAAERGAGLAEEEGKPL
jgi:hypothetical protein